jgi:hypothetical protein
MEYCPIHKIEYLSIGGDECPLCARDETDNAVRGTA